MADICQASCGERFFFSLLDSLIRLEPEVLHLCLEEGIILGIADGKAEERLLRENKLHLENMLVIFPAWEISHAQIKNVNDLSDLHFPTCTP